MIILNTYIKELIMDKLINLTELAESLRISIRQLQNIRKHDSFPKPVMLGKNRPMYKVSDINNWLSNGGLVYGR